jgi:hypothetical protein
MARDRSGQSATSGFMRRQGCRSRRCKPRTSLARHTGKKLCNRHTMVASAGLWPLSSPLAGQKRPPILRAGRFSQASHLSAANPVSACADRARRHAIRPWRNSWCNAPPSRSYEDCRRDHRLGLNDEDLFRNGRPKPPNASCAGRGLWSDKSSNRKFL